MFRAAGMVSLGQVGLDGTKVRANTSRRKAMSYARLREKQKVLADEVSALLAEADAIDEAEDTRFGKDKRGEECGRCSEGAAQLHRPGLSDHEDRRRGLPLHL